MALKNKFSDSTLQTDRVDSATAVLTLYRACPAEIKGCRDRGSRNRPRFGRAAANPQAPATACAGCRGKRHFRWGPLVYPSPETASPISYMNSIPHFKEGPVSPDGPVKLR